METAGGPERPAGPHGSCGEPGKRASLYRPVGGANIGTKMKLFLYQCY